MAKVKFKQVTEREPWDVFAEKGTGARDGLTKEMAIYVAKAYHQFCEKHNPEIGACLLCGQKFKGRKGGGIEG